MLYNRKGERSRIPEDAITAGARPPSEEDGPMVRKLKGKVLSPSRDIFIQEVRGVDVGVDSINSTPADAIFMSMLWLIEFLKDAFVQNLLDPSLCFLSIGLAGPVLLGFVKSVMRVVGEIKVTRHHREALLRRLHMPDEALDTLGSFLCTIGREVDAPDVQSAGVASEA